MGLEKYTPEIIETLQKIIRIKTVLDTPVEGGPFGAGNKKCLETVLEICNQLGFRTKNLDGYCGYAEIGEGEELVGIIGHLDVVPEGEGWLYPAYSGEIVEGELWGRGAWDDKGPVVVSIYAIKALMDNGFNFNKRVRLIFGCNEESGSLCMEHYLKVDEPISYGVSPDANFPVIFGEKSINNIEVSGDNVIEEGMVSLTYLDAGIVVNAVPDKCVFKLSYGCDKCKAKVVAAIEESLNNDGLKFDVVDENKTLTYTVYGKAAHGSMPEIGINAGSFAIKALASANAISNSFISFYSKYIGTCIHGENAGCFATDEYGDLAFNVGLIHYENNKFSMKINSRLPFTTTTEKQVEQMKDTMEKEPNIKVTLLGGSTGFVMDKNSVMIQSLTKAYQDVTGDYKTQPMCIGGGTYAREFKNCVAFGPEMEGYGEIIIHQPNERIQLRALEDLMKIYYQGYADLISKVSFK